MAKKIIFLDGLTLHCDACGFDIHNCDCGSHWINFPCPECGANMLTAQDHESARKLLAFVAKLNKWFGWLGKEEKDQKPSDTGLYCVNPRGDSLIITKRPNK